MSLPRIRKTAATAAVLAIAGLALSACSFLPHEAARDEDGDVVAGGQGDVFALTVGDCLNETFDEEISDVPLVPCDQPHDYEVFYEFQLEGDEYPGDDEVGSLAGEGCGAQFDGFAGIAYADSALDYTAYTPLEEGWNSIGDRLVSCLIFEPDVKTVGSLAGAAR